MMVRERSFRKRVVVRPHKRRTKGKTYKVSSHYRVLKQKKIPRLRYRTVGLLQTVTDSDGRFKGSRVYKLPPGKEPGSLREATIDAIKELDTLFFNHEISLSEYYDRLNKLLAG